MLKINSFTVNAKISLESWRSTESHKHDSVESSYSECQKLNVKNSSLELSAQVTLPSRLSYQPPSGWILVRQYPSVFSLENRKYVDQWHRFFMGCMLALSTDQRRNEPIIRQDVTKQYWENADHCSISSGNTFQPDRKTRQMFWT